MLCLLSLMTLSACGDMSDSSSSEGSITQSTSVTAVTTTVTSAVTTAQTASSSVPTSAAPAESAPEEATSVTTTTSTPAPTTTVTTTTPKPVNFTQLNKTVYAKEYLLFLQSPYSNSAAYRYIPTYSELKVSAVSEDGSWLRVSYNGITGYVLQAKTTETKPVVTTTTTTPRITTTRPLVGGLPTDTDTSTDRDINKLKAQIESLLAKTSGTWSVYVKNLRTGETLSINNRQYYAASLIKMFGMATAYQEIEAGHVTEASLTPLLKPMIIYSDNDCFNNIIAKLGKTKIHDWIEQNGYTGTQQYHGFMTYATNYEQTVINPNAQNLTTAEDCGKLLESIYLGQCVSKSASQKMLDLLCQQYWTHKIPAGVPAGITVANKTGEVDENNHDCAIVFLPNDPYILCVLSEQNSYNAMAFTGTIVNISKLTYNYFTSK